MGMRTAVFAMKRLPNHAKSMAAVSAPGNKPEIKLAL
jgi:hypothetical protein